MNECSDDPKFLKAICETIAEGIMVIDAEGKIRYFNHAAEGITGYSREEVIGKDCMILDTDTCIFMGESGNQKHCPIFDKAESVTRRCRIKSKDGRTVYLLKRVNPIRDDSGKIISGVEAMTDITPLYMKELEVEALKQELKQEYSFMGILGTGPEMQKVFEQIRNAATSEAPIIIYGESGVGKELVANAIHKMSRRKDGPFIKVSCAALNEYLLESELFGHKRGSFTRAISDREGRFEAASGGSIFLDEIGDMPLSMQVKLLRVIQEKEVERVGDHRPISVDVRLISATNKDLNSLVAQGKFREDLFYRVNVIPVYVPPLRERKEDIPILISHYLRKISYANGKDIRRVSPGAMEIMKNYNWPGNVRQLINTLEYSAVTCKGDTIEVSDLPGYIFMKSERTEKRHSNREDIISLLSLYKGNKTLVARHLGISRVTLWKRMKEMDIT